MEGGLCQHFTNDMVHGAGSSGIQAARAGLDSNQAESQSDAHASQSASSILTDVVSMHADEQPLPHMEVNIRKYPISRHRTLPLTELLLGVDFALRK